MLSLLNCLSLKMLDAMSVLCVHNFFTLILKALSKYLNLRLVPVELKWS